MKSTRVQSRVKTTSAVNTAVRVIAFGSVFAAASAFAAVSFKSDINAWYMGQRLKVNIVDGTYPTDHGEVPYRLCYSKNTNETMKYPSILFAPGQTVNITRWTVDCARLADQGYVTFIKGRTGTNYPEWEEEVTKALQTMKTFAFIDGERIAAIASSFGNQEIQSYGLENPRDFKSYIALSTFNNPWVMLGSLAPFDIPTMLLSGGGEEPIGERDCDHDAYVWSQDFSEKMQNENPKYYIDWKAFDQETYGCVYHSYMWDFGSPAETESIAIILQVLSATVGTEPREI